MSRVAQKLEWLLPRLVCADKQCVAGRTLKSHIYSAFSPLPSQFTKSGCEIRGSRPACAVCSTNLRKPPVWTTPAERMILFCCPMHPQNIAFIKLPRWLCMRVILSTTHIYCQWPKSYLASDIYIYIYIWRLNLQKTINFYFSEIISFYCTFPMISIKLHLGLFD